MGTAKKFLEISWINIYKSLNKKFEDTKDFSLRFSTYVYISKIFTYKR